ncbi:MAG: FMN-binding negative transcriptional regulator [Caldilineaceae bacterium]
MYIPKSFVEHDIPTLQTFIQQNAFATVITMADSGPFATHMPFVLDPVRGSNGVLISHMAKANPQWRHFAHMAAQDIDTLVIFQGPHAYISPSWYASEFSVPTWNYTAVHAYGRPVIIEDEQRLQAMLDELVAVYESAMPQPWSVPWSDARYTNLTKAIVGFEMEITRLEGKFKLNQNRPVADQQGVIAQFQDSAHTDERIIAQRMMRNLMADPVASQ